MKGSKWKASRTTGLRIAAEAMEPLLDLRAGNEVEGRALHAATKFQ